MNKKRFFGLAIPGLIMIFVFSLAPSVTHAIVAPFWYGTEQGYSPPPAGYDPTLPDDGVAGPPTVPCSGTAPSLTANVQRNMLGIFGANNNPEGIRGLTINKAEAWDGYTLISCQNGCAHPSKPSTKFDALMIDNEGNFVNGWFISPFPAKMLPGGYVMGTQEEADLGAESHSLIVQDWCGKEVRRYNFDETNAPGCIFHHDHNKEGNPVGYYAPPISPDENFLTKLNGNSLALAMCSPDVAMTGSVSNYPLQDDTFFIIDNNGKILWRWNAWEHFEQMGFGEKAKDYIKNNKVVGAVQDPDQSDWLHMNNLNWLGPNKWHKGGDNRFNPDNMIWDSRNSNIIAIIANTEKPGSWKKGDIIWRIGPEYGEGTAWASLGQIIGPHHAHMIPASLPGGGNILVFDNGGMAGYGPLRNDCPGIWPNALSDYSRVIEFNPTTYEIVWEYNLLTPFTDADGAYNRKFFSQFMSSAQRLENGNTLIAEANSGRIFEVTAAGEMVWEYLAGTGETRPGIPYEVGAATYRAYKVPKSWLPKGGVCK